MLRLKNNGQAVNPICILPGSKKMLPQFFYAQYQVQGTSKKTRKEKTYSLDLNQIIFAVFCKTK